MKKAKRTHKQRFIIFLKVILAIVLVILLIAGIFACINAVSLSKSKSFISELEQVKYKSQLEPELDDDGYYTFKTDDELKVLQLTDVHLGGGFMSVGKDKKSINAVSAMITAEKPDLVVVTGDVSYPVPFQAGTFNNKSSAKLFAELMEKLGVYWCMVYGNHDTEAYSYFSRESLSALYGSDKYPHCLFQSGPEEVDGYGNYVIKVKNSKDEITQALILLDTHSYVDDDYLGLLWKYDTVHENQVKWYEDTIKQLTDENNGVTPKSLCFYHIPSPEYKTAWMEYRENGNKDTDDVKYIYGEAGEKDDLICCGLYNYGFFDKVLELGSTQAIFCGHDHLNNFSLDYKGVKLNYSYSIDYLAYIGIENFGKQRGCNVITINPDGTYENKLESYYQDKYVTVAEKESPELEKGYYD